MRHRARRFLLPAVFPLLTLAALAAGWLVTGPPADYPAIPAPVIALEALALPAAALRRPAAALTPHAAAVPATPAWIMATARVHYGDSFSALARRYYHHASWWPRIWWANRRLAANPSLVPSHIQLVIPIPRHPRWTTTRAALAAIPPPPPPPPPPAAAAQSAPAPAAAGPVPAQPAAPAATGAGAAPGSFQACVISRESGGNPSAVNASSGAGGLYQFLPSTWAALGHSGLPENASVAEQNQAFAQAYAQSGTSPWAPYDGC